MIFHVYLCLWFFRSQQVTYIGGSVGRSVGLQNILKIVGLQKILKTKTMLVFKKFWKIKNVGRSSKNFEIWKTQGFVAYIAWIISPRSYDRGNLHTAYCLIWPNLYFLTNFSKRLTGGYLLVYSFKTKQQLLVSFRSGLQTVIPLLIRGAMAYALRFWAVTRALVRVTTARWSPITLCIIQFFVMLGIIKKLCFTPTYYL